MTQPLVLHAAEETLEAVHTRRHAAYPAYKPSGVEWLGDVPEHWAVKRLKFLAHLVNAKVEADEETTKPYIGMEHVESWTGKLRLPDDVFVPTGVSNVFRSGDVLFGKLRPYLAKATTIDFGGLCSSELMVLRAEEMDRHFLLYTLLSDGFIKLVNSSTYGSKMPRANWEFIGGMLTPLPPLEEQQAIARFLDEQTRKIDDLIEAKRSLLDLLKEKRQAVITHAVTRGLDPAAKLKTSGVEWLGDVPKHWDVKPLKRLVGKIGSGKTPRGGSQVYVSSGVMLLRSQNVYDDGLRLGDVVFIDEDTDEEMSGTRVKSGDVLLNITGASIGRSSLVPDGIPKANVNQHVCIIRPTKISAAFLHAIICSKGIKNTIASEESGTSREGLNFRQIGRIAIPVPPLEEQQAIARFLDEETQKIDDLESVVREAMETLELLRAGIISAAVTGKIDVREEGV